MIQPVFDHAFGFRGNYAEVVVFPSDDAVKLLSGDRNSGTTMTLSMKHT